VDGFVYSIGQKYFGWLDAQKLCNCFLDRLALRVTGQLFGTYLSQTREHAR
jgi:hypothetical protein